VSGTICHLCLGPLTENDIGILVPRGAPKKTRSSNPDPSTAGGVCCELIFWCLCNRCIQLRLNETQGAPRPPHQCGELSSRHEVPLGHAHAQCRGK